MARAADQEACQHTTSRSTPADCSGPAGLHWRRVGAATTRESDYYLHRGLPSSRPPGSGRLAGVARRPGSRRSHTEGWYQASERQRFAAAATRPGRQALTGWRQRPRHRQAPSRRPGGAGRPGPRRRGDHARDGETLRTLATWTARTRGRKASEPLGAGGSHRDNRPRQPLEPPRDGPVLADVLSPFPRPTEPKE